MSNLLNISRMDSDGSRVVSTNILQIDNDGLYAITFGNNTPSIYSGAQLKELFSILSDGKNYNENIKKGNSVEPINLNKKEEDDEK